MSRVWPCGEAISSILFSLLMLPSYSFTLSSYCLPFLPVVPPISALGSISAGFRPSPSSSPTYLMAAASSLILSLA